MSLVLYTCFQVRRLEKIFLFHLDPLYHHYPTNRNGIGAGKRNEGGGWGGGGILCSPSPPISSCCVTPGNRCVCLFLQPSHDKELADFTCVLFEYIEKVTSQLERGSIRTHTHTHTHTHACMHTHDCIHLIYIDEDRI